jgi:hypothetical protein
MPKDCDTKSMLEDFQEGGVKKGRILSDPAFIL